MSLSRVFSHKQKKHSVFQKIKISSLFIYFDLITSIDKFSFLKKVPSQQNKKLMFLNNIYILTPIVILNSLFIKDFHILNKLFSLITNINVYLLALIRHTAHYYNPIFTIFFFSLGTIVASIASENTDSDELLNRSLVSLESKRDYLFLDTNINYLEDLTYEISENIISHKSDMNHEIWLNCVYSILKTRHLFPGRVDLLPLYYNNSNTHVSEGKDIFPLIFVADTIAQISIEDINFYTDTQKLLNENEQFSLETRITNKINDNIYTKKMAENYRADIIEIINNNCQISKICEIEHNFAPIITFHNLFYEMMSSPLYRGYEVLGITEYAYWPSTKFSSKKRKIIQKEISLNDYSGRFKPLSLVATQIDSKAIQDFPILENRTGSFFVYSTINLFKSGVKKLFLVSKCKSLVSYNRDKFMFNQAKYSSLQFIKSVNTEEMLNYYAGQRVAQAQCEYAYILYNKKDLDSHDCDYRWLSFNYFKQAANQENAKAQYILSMMNISGICVSQNEIEASNLCRLSADNGFVEAQYSLGLMYEEGIGVNKDMYEANKWYNLATNGGCAKMQYNIGRIFDSNLSLGVGIGLGITYDKVALRLYKLSGTQGYEEAQYKLGMLYETGNEVEQNSKESIYWYYRAAITRYKKAQHNLV